MPCYTVQLVSVVFKAKHKDVLKAAAMQLNWSYAETRNKVYVGNIVVDMEKQTATVPQNLQSELNKLKQTYSYCALQQVARQKNWKLFKNPQKQNAYVLQKF